MIADLPHCPLPDQVIQIPAEETSLAANALTFVLEPLQPLREQLTAITGLGLELDDLSPAALRRVRVPGAAGGEDLSVLAGGQRDGQRVIFLHGSPGLGEEWARFLTDVPAGRLYLAPDRPGYGDSGNQPLTDLEEQARAVLPLLGQADRSNAILVGYSYGGPVALRLAADHPDRVAGILLIGAAADPALEETHPLQQVAALDFFAQLLPAELATSNAELMALREDLQRLGPDLARLSMPVTIVQGQADSLVPAANADYLRAHLPSEAAPRSIMIEGADHFLPWTHHELLAKALDCLIATPPGHSADASSAGK
ncbi:MAG: alpha/beta fold hydrolase [Alphaproteobacteria bacterium]|nr:alpha/beta fold hydrolase [Alphaproteobacteria bacterium]